MRPLEERRRVRQLTADGLNASHVAGLTGIPRSTVRDWVDARRRRTPKERPADACEACGHPRHDFATLPDGDYAYLLGFYLGDGTVSRAPKGVFKLRIFTDSRYRAVIAECALAMAVVMPTSRVGIHEKVGCVEIHSYSRAWPCFFPQYGAGPKHTRPISLTEWQRQVVERRPQQFVRGLMHSDGCRITNWVSNRVHGKYYYPRYLFSQVSEDIKELFCISLEQLGVEYTWPNWKTVSIARADSVRRLDEFVGPKS